MSQEATAETNIHSYPGVNFGVVRSTCVTNKII